MENNIIKESRLEILPEIKEIVTIEENKLPVLSNKEKLLPAIIEQKELALMEIKKEFYKVKEHHSLIGIARFLRNVLVLFAKLVRFTFLASTRMVSFVMFSAIVILSTTIITKNVVNSHYGAKVTQDKTTYSIYSVKDDVEAKAKSEIHSEEENENKVEETN